jgi:hypothetical protein
MTFFCALAALPAMERALASGTAPASTEGRLVTRHGDERVDGPLAHTGVQIRVAGHLADVTVRHDGPVHAAAAEPA